MNKLINIQNNSIPVIKYKYSAIIVEPRKHKALYFVLNNVCDCLSDEWKIILFHGSENILYSIVYQMYKYLFLHYEV